MNKGLPCCHGHTHHCPGLRKGQAGSPRLIPFLAVVSTFGSVHVISKGTATKEGVSRGGREDAAMHMGEPGARVRHSAR